MRRFRLIAAEMDIPAVREYFHQFRIDFFQEIQRFSSADAQFPAGIGRINDVYRQVLYIKADEYRRLVEIKDLLEEETDKMQLSTENIQFDFNPMNVL